MDDPRREDDPHREDDLAERVAELEQTVADLRRELGPPRGPFGLPRPPTPGEVVRFTGEYAIPTAIAVLEANVRALELLGEALRLASPERRGGGSELARDRAETVGRATMARVDRALNDLQDAFEAGDLPRDPTARTILADARRLSAEIEERLAAEPPEENDRPGVDGPSAEESVTTVDVEEELRTIRDELDDGEGREDGTADRDDPDDDER